MDEEMITISKKYYDSLVEDSQLLDRLRAAGVDNWGGYSEAFSEENEEVH